MFNDISKISATIAVASLVFLAQPYQIIPAQFGDFHVNEYARHLHFNPYAETRWDNTVVLLGQPDAFGDIEAGLGVLWAMSRTFGLYQLAGHGIRYVVSDAYLDNHVGFYEIIAQGDGWIVYELIRP